MISSKDAKRPRDRFLAGPSRLDSRSREWLPDQIEAWRIAVSKEVPHGIRYSLTPHEPYGKSVLGYDNAHAVKPPKKFKYAGHIMAYDRKHRHVSDHGTPYEFVDAQQLINDFFADVDRVLLEIKAR